MIVSCTSMLKTNPFMQEYKHNVTSSLLRQTLHEGCYKKKNPSLRSDLLHAKDGEVNILISHQW